MQLLNRHAQVYNSGLVPILPDCKKMTGFEIINDQKKTSSKHRQLLMTKKKERLQSAICQIISALPEIVSRSTGVLIL